MLMILNIDCKIDIREPEHSFLIYIQEPKSSAFGI